MKPYKLKIHFKNMKMKITKKTYVSEILTEYGDIADVMEIFGVKRVGGFGLRKFLSKFITIKTAAFIHRVPLDRFIQMVQDAVNNKNKQNKH
jgi:virulence-associated protein VapD